jgi:low temperature requirement protein LtrA
LWWTYFDRFAAVARARLRTHHDPVLAAADGYSYLHLLVVAGIIVFAVGMRFATHRAGQPLSDAARLALCGGVALYVAGHAAFRLRMVGTVGYEKLAAAGLILVVWAAGSGLPAWSVAAAVTVVLAVLCAHETRLDRQQPRAADSSTGDGPNFQ